MTRHWLPTAGVRAAVAPSPTTGLHAVSVVACTYSQTDTYGTQFAPGCFTESLRQRMPTFVWGHDWRSPIGRFTSHKDTDRTLVLTGYLDDFDAVPHARQAWVQMQSGTLDQFSVGFDVLDQEQLKDGTIRFTKCRLDEVSVVVAGSVPGTKVLAMVGRERSRVASIWSAQERLDAALARDDVIAAADAALALLAARGFRTGESR